MRSISIHLAACLLLLPLAAGAAEEGVSKVRAWAEGNKVHVSYTLTGKGEYDVALRLSDNGGRSFAIEPRTLSGAVGGGVEPGPDRRIVWDALKDVPELKGNRFAFQVTASRPRGNKRVLLGLAAGAGAAAGAYMLMPKDGTISVRIPDPEE